ncbi:MAG: type II secretion system minor pseudopilin GspK [Gammaproteobacteria bacterium]|nr:type II secretion system minor pseudopilin GspK [Gammaproteobacteria bacterium]
MMRPLTYRKQRGVTLLVVLVVVALVTLISAQLIERGVFSERRTTLMLGRDQAFQIALGGEELASSWLALGFDSPDVVHLNQKWATTAFEFPIEGGMIKGSVRDAQTCFNLNALGRVQNDDGPGGGDEPRSEGDRDGGRDQGRDGSPSVGPSNDPNGPQRRPRIQVIYSNLVNEVLKQVDLPGVTPESLVAPVVDWIDEDDLPTGIDGAEDLLYTGYDVPYRAANSLMASKSELRMVKGYSAKVYEAIKDYVCVLPRTDIDSINVNTLLPEQALLLTAMDEKIDASLAQSIIDNRPEEGYDATSFKAQLPNNSQINTDKIIFTSNYFVIRIQVSLNGATFIMRSLVERTGGQRDQMKFRVVTRYFGEF